MKKKVELITVAVSVHIDFCPFYHHHGLFIHWLNQWKKKNNSISTIITKKKKKPNAEAIAFSIYNGEWRWSMFTVAIHAH